MKFHTQEERKNHPQASLIPDVLWKKYFINNDISSTLLECMKSTTDQDLVSRIKSDTFYFGNDLYNDYNQIFVCFICSHPNLSKEAFIEIVKYFSEDSHLRNECFVIKNKLIDVIVACGNTKFLDIALDYFNDPELISGAFRSAAGSGLNVLEYLDKKAPGLMQKKMQLHGLYMMRLIASNGHLDSLKYLELKAPDLVQNIIKKDGFDLIDYAASDGHLDVLKYLESKAPNSLLRMIKGDNYYYAFRLAATNGHVNVLSYIIEKAPNLCTEMIKANDYHVMRDALVCGHANSVNFLLRYSAARDLIPLHSYCNYITTAYLDNSAHTDIKELFKHPRIFAYMLSHYHNIQPFIIEQLEELKTRKLHGNPMHRLHNKQEAECLFYLLHYLIERVGLGAKEDILFLLNIPELQAILPTARPPHNTTNVALRAAIIKKSGARRDDSTWDEVIEKLYAIPAVIAQAERDDHYPNERRGRFDLSAIVDNTESSMQALTPLEETQLQTLNEYYKPKIQQLNEGAPNFAWANVLNCFENHYNENKIKFINTKGKLITLPLEWSDFKKINLSKTDSQLALQAYYKSSAHTAYRFYLRPNPWIADNAIHVEVLADGSDKAANYKGYKDIITVMTLAAFDKDKQGLDFDITGRINAFIDAIALTNRAHNWDKTRVKKDAQGKKPNGTLDTEQYDDLEGDKPSCGPGMKKRLIQSLLGHPLFESVEAIAEEGVRCEIQDSIKAELAKLENKAVIELHAYLQDIEEAGISAKTPQALMFNEDRSNALMVKIFKKYNWIKEETLKCAVAKRLEELGVAHDKNIFITGDFFQYTQKQIILIAKERGIKSLCALQSDTKPRATQTVIGVLEAVKSLVKIYCQPDPRYRHDDPKSPHVKLLLNLKPFTDAANEKELEKIWARWIPQTERENEFAKDIHTRFPAVFNIKQRSGQMTYDNLPDWYQELKDDEFCQKALIELDQSCKLYLTQGCHDKQHDIKRDIIHRALSFMQGKVKNRALVENLRKNILDDPSILILSKNIQSKSEIILKVLAAISIVFGIALAIKRMLDTNGKSANFFKPLAETNVVAPFDWIVKSKHSILR